MAALEVIGSQVGAQLAILVSDSYDAQYTLRVAHPPPYSRIAESFVLPVGFSTASRRVSRRTFNLQLAGHFAAERTRFMEKAHLYDSTVSGNPVLTKPFGEFSA